MYFRPRDLDWWAGPVVTAHHAAKKGARIAGNLAKKGWKKAQDYWYGSYKAENKNSTSPSLGDPMFKHGEYFAYKFYNETGKLPELRHFEKVFGKDKNSSFFKGYINAANRMYESYKRDGKLLDDHAYNLLNEYRTNGIVPKYHDIQIADAIRRANNPKVAPRLKNEKINAIAPYLAVPGGVLFAGAVPGMLGNVLAPEAAAAAQGAINYGISDLLTKGLKKEVPALANYNLPSITNLLNDVQKSEQKDIASGTLPGHAWHHSNVKTAGILAEETAKLLSRGSAPTSAPTGADTNVPLSTTHSATIPAGGGGGGGYSSFFINGRKRRYYYNKYSRFYNRRFRRGYSKNHKKYYKKYRKYRRFY